MNTLKNNVQLTGNVGRAPEILIFGSGKKMARFSIATRETYRNHLGEKVTDTHWHNIVAWGKMAEMVEKEVPKGLEIEIQGKLSSRSYEDKEGVKRHITEVVCRELQLIEK
ncbi:single-stranded DNA-binding protein [Salinimicrobium flavum]|uniref:Single-stranded DNA-binding protein n=1 Tax=Salinimicrobium flavum TaxID=1737065 RepID=A0ABW5IV63_9FLAO